MPPRTPMAGRPPSETPDPRRTWRISTVTQAPPPVSYRTPRPAEARCRDCGAPIAFETTAYGRLRPIDPETGEVHFATCPARKARRRVLPTDRCHLEGC